MNRIFVCDSSSLISLSESCLLSVIKFFNKRGIEFVISPAVYEETVSRPLSISMKAYRWSALNIERYVDERVITIVRANVLDVAKDVMDKANSMFFARGDPIHLVDLGEAEMIALAFYLGEAHLLMDERTTRMLIEEPMSLKEHLEKELNVNVMVDKKRFMEFSSYVKEMKVYRSADLVFAAYKFGYFKYKPRDSIEAALYKLRYSGCSISFDEIEELRELM